jgi:drug/metabolite transporter (DMT)-like permease
MRTANIAVPSTSASTPSLRFPLPVMVVAFCLLWASAFAVAKFAMADSPPLFLLALRFLLASVVIFGGAAVFGVPLMSLSGRDALVFALLGIANQATFLGLVVHRALPDLQRNETSATLVLVSSAPRSVFPWCD